MNPTAMGPAAPTSAAALDKKTAIPLLPGSDVYSPAWMTGYQQAVIRLSSARMASFAGSDGTNRNAGYSSTALIALTRSATGPLTRLDTSTNRASPASPAPNLTATPMAASSGLTPTTSTR